MEEKHTSAAQCPHCGYVNGTPPREKYHMTPGILLHGKYTVGKVLGYGGFGVTYIGWDQSLRRKVAIKEFLPGELATRMPGENVVRIYEKTYHQFEAGLERFVEEAQCLAKFNHVVSIVDVYDVFIEHNTGYFVMEYLEGSDVKALIQKNGPMPYESARLIISDILKTLSIVHKEGILHRDISPDNIFITVDNRIKLLDFGAARYATDTYSEKLSIILKPGYAPEEQYRKNGVQGSWSDIYAVAATLYKMLTGITPQESVERMNNDTLQSPLEMGVSIPVGANTALMRALEVPAKKRTHTAEDFLWELEHTHGGGSSHVVGTEVKKAEKQKSQKQKKEGNQATVWIVIASGIAILLVVAAAVGLTNFISSAVPISTAVPWYEVSTDLHIAYSVCAEGEFVSPDFHEKKDLNFFDTVYQSSPVEDVNMLYLQVKQPMQMEGAQPVVTVKKNGRIISPSGFSLYEIPVDGPTEITITSKTGSALFSKSSTYTISCMQAYAKLSGIRYRIDGRKRAVPEFDAETNHYVISEKVPATAEELEVEIIPEEDGFTVTPGKNFTVLIADSVDSDNKINIEVTVSDPDGVYETNQYQLTFTVEEREEKETPQPSPQPEPVQTVAPTREPTPVPTPKPIKKPTPTPTSAPKKVTVPNVVGKTFAQAQAELSKLGLKVTKQIETTSKSEMNGRVIRIYSMNGTMVESGSRVTVVIGNYVAPVVTPKATSAPKPTPVVLPTVTASPAPSPTPAPTPDRSTPTPSPTPKKVSVPNVNGKTFAQAQSMLSQEGLNAEEEWESTNNPDLHDRVIRTIPPIRAFVPFGGRVIVRIGKYVAPTPQVTETTVPSEPEPTWIPSGSL